MGAEAVLLTGPFGAGKTSVAVELAGLLDDAGAAYAVIDLDWLGWYQVGPGHAQPDHEDLGMLLANLEPMLRNLLAVGVDRLILARAIADAAPLREVLARHGVDLRIARITAAIEVLEARLLADATSSRADDLAMLRAWHEAGIGEGIEEATFANEGPLRDTAIALRDWLGWGP